MKIIKKSALITGIILTGSSLLLSACVSDSLDTQVLGKAPETQLQTRNYQSRAFDTTNKNQLLRSAIATLQDLGFVLDKADETLGTLTATKFTNHTALRMTITLRSRGKTQTLVRANAQYGLNTLEDPAAYQDFFSALSKAMFLDAHEVE